MQPPARMTFKFDGNLPREVRSDSAAQTALNQRSIAPQDTSPTAGANRPSGSFKPRGFSTHPGRPTPEAGSGYRLPGKGAHMSPALPPKDMDSLQANAGAGGDGPVVRKREPRSPAQRQHPVAAARPTRDAPSRDMREHSPYEDDVEALERMIRGADGTSPVRERDRAEDRSPSAQPARTGRVAGFRKPGTAEAPVVLPSYPSAETPGGSNERGAFPPGRAPYAGRQDRTDELDNDTVYDATMAELPIDEDEPWAEDGYARRYRGGPSWTRIFASIAAAIVTGAIFGYIVLALFTGEPLLPAGAGADPGTAVALPVGAGAKTTPDGDEAGAKTTDPPAQASAGASGGTAGTGGTQPDQTAGAGDAQVPASVSYLLQYGVFQSAASMNEAVQELTSQGIAAASDTADGYRVYAGIATTKPEAEKLAASLTDAELYVKAMENRELSLPQTAAAVSWATYLEESDALGRALAEASAALLSEGGTKPLGEQSAADVKAALGRWTASKAGMPQWSGSRSEPAGALAAQLEASAGQLNAYGSEPSPERLRAAQTSAMKAALIARQLRDELGEDGD